MIVRITLDNNCFRNTRYYVLNQQIIIVELGKSMAGDLEFAGGNELPDMVKKRIHSVESMVMNDCLAIGEICGNSAESSNCASVNLFAILRANIPLTIHPYQQYVPVLFFKQDKEITWTLTGPEPSNATARR